MVEDPRDLGAREIGVQQQSSLLPHHGFGAFIAGSVAAVWGLQLAMILPALAMLVLIAFVLACSRIWTMRTVERPASA